MLAGATDREPLGGDDGKSGASLVRCRIDGAVHVLKQTSLDQDWTMRLTGDRWFRPLIVWRDGIMASVPACIDHATVAMAFEPAAPGGPRLGILMRDVSDELVPEGDTPVTLEQHETFVDHMATLGARFAGFEGDPRLTNLDARLRFFHPDNLAGELDREDRSPVVDIAARGWEELPDAAPRLGALVGRLHANLGPLLAALTTTPQTFLHGDWKMGNLGFGRDGRTILLDWAYPGRGPAALELAWYLALNAARLPASKEEAIAAYREGLEQHGVATSGWWDAQLGSCLVAIMVMFGWEKAVGGGDELAWWDERVDRERRWLE